ncbi:hypothetical protein AM496_07640, partial [Helicobacter pylori]
LKGGFMPKKCLHLLQTSDLSLDEIKLLLNKASVYANDFNAVKCVAIAVMIGTLSWVISPFLLAWIFFSKTKSSV